MSKDLRTFLAEVVTARPGSVKVIASPTDPRSGIADRILAYAGSSSPPALLFGDVTGADLPCLTNLLASEDRLALACGLDAGALRRLPGPDLSGTGPEPRVVSDGEAPVREVAVPHEDIDLRRLPIPTHRSTDAGPFLTAAVAVMRDPVSGEVNAGIYRCQVHGPRSLGIWNIGTHHGAAIVRRNRERGLDTPVALVIGHHPALLLAAVARLPMMGGEYRAAGALLGEPLDVVTALTADLPVPARAELVIEGVVRAQDARDEGPFTEWTDLAVGGGTKPVIDVLSMSRREDAILQSIQPRGREHHLLGTLPRIASLQANVADVVERLVAVQIPLEARMHCYLSIAKTSDAEPVRAGFAALNTEPDNLRMVIVVDDDVDVSDDRDVWWAVGTRFDAARDLTIVRDWHGPGGIVPTAWSFDATGGKTPTTSSVCILDATKPGPPVRYPTRATDIVLDRGAVPVEDAIDLTVHGGSSWRVWN